MNILGILGILSGLLSAICYLPYIRDILLGKSKPERASWFIWTVLGSIAFFSQLSKGATNSLWMVGVQTIGVVIISLLSIKFGSDGFSKRDIFALLIAAIGVIMWFFTKDASIALYITILVDAAGSILTVIKSYEDPESETISMWILASLGGLLSALAVGQLNFILLLYPVYICLANLSVVTAIYLGRRK